MTTSIAQATIDVVATAQVHGGTRVITLTVASAHDTAHTVTTPPSRRDWHAVVLRAYDSNHPGDELTVLVAGDPDRDAVIAQAREFATAALRPLDADEPCACWAGWDPNCGQPGCWGYVRNSAEQRAELAASIAWLDATTGPMDVSDLADLRL